MYRDNTLIPSEAIRLLALGLLADRPLPYGELAREVRHFTSHIVGPSLDLVAQPIELLKVEGLIEPVKEVDPAVEETPLSMTKAGEEALQTLLASNVRAPVSDINKLIIALKMRFLHLLPPAQQKLQAEMIAEMTERELLRLVELRAHHSATKGNLVSWLDQDIEQTRKRLEWFHALGDGVA